MGGVGWERRGEGTNEILSIISTFKCYVGDTRESSIHR